ncbi:hypothetical protein [Campylobacter lanienae]|uniref:hypothetical protein n=1 Tax=Campylobacter lanienae TaxID=75658 RepID=UPI00164DFB0B|nr:hypothetical protein [Campylobacter lanienae]
MDNSLIIFGGLFLLSVIFSKISDKYGVPALLIYLVKEREAVAKEIISKALECKNKG